MDCLPIPQIFLLLLCLACVTPVIYVVYTLCHILISGPLSACLSQKAGP